MVTLTSTARITTRTVAHAPVTSTPPPPLPHSAPPTSSKFQQFTLNDTTYSLTTHKIFKPRSFLLRRNDYVIANAALYQIQADFRLPEIAPGYSYKRLAQTQISAIHFAFHSQIGFPAPQPTKISIGAIAHFADVFEPVGADVESAGVVLSMQAVQLIQCGVCENLAVPKKLKVEMGNVVGKSALCYAVSGLSAENFVSEGQIESFSVRRLQESVLQNDFAAAKELIIEYSKTVNHDVEAEIRDQNWVLMMLQKDFSQFKSYYLGALKMLLEFEKEDNQKAACTCMEIYKLLNGLPQSGYYRSMIPLSIQENRTSEENSKLVKKDFDDLQIEVAFKTKQWNMNLQQNNFDEFFLNAYQTKNVEFVKYQLGMANILNVQTRELVKQLQNSKLQAKDIKTVFTASSLLHVVFGNVTTVEIGSYFSSKGFQERLEEITFDEKVVRFAQRIMLATVCNIKDDVEMVKIMLQKLDIKKVQFDQQQLTTFAFICQNRKIYSFLTQKFSQNLQLNAVQTCLITQQHVDMLQVMGYCTPYALSGLLNILSEEDVYLVLKEAIIDGNYKLYSDELLQKLLLKQNLKSANLILQSGYSFPHSAFDYSIIAKLSETQLFQIVSIIQKQFSETINNNYLSSMIIIICSLIEKNKINILQKLCDKFKVDLNQILDSRYKIVQSWVSLFNDQHTLSPDNQFDILLQIQTSTNIDIMNQDTFSLILDKFKDNNNQIPEVILEKMVNISVNKDQILGEVNVQNIIEAKFSCLLVNLNFEKNIGSARMLSQLIDQVEEQGIPDNQPIFMGFQPRMGFNQNHFGKRLSVSAQPSVSLVSQDQQFLLSNLLQHKELYQIKVVQTNDYNRNYVSNLVLLQRKICSCSFKLTPQQIDIFLSNYQFIDDLEAQSEEEQINIIDSYIQVLSPDNQQQQTTQNKTFAADQFIIHNNTYLLEKVIQLQNQSIKQKLIFSQVIMHQQSDIITFMSHLQKISKELYLQALLGLIRNNQQFTLQIVQQLQISADSTFFNLIKQQIETRPFIFHLITTVDKNHIQTLIQLFTEQQLQEIKHLRSEKNLTIFADSMSQNNQFIPEFIVDTPINANLDNCLHIVMQQNLYVCADSMQKKMLLEIQKVVDVKQLLVQKNSQNLTPIHFICNIDAFLLVESYNIDIFGIDQNFSLFTKLQRPDFVLFQYLLQKKVNPFVMTNGQDYVGLEKQYFIFQYLSQQILRQDQIQCLLDDNLLDQEQFIQTVLCFEYYQINNYMQFINSDYVYKQKRTAELFITSILNNSFASQDVPKLIELSIKFGLFTHQNLLSKISKNDCNRQQSPDQITDLVSQGNLLLSVADQNILIEIIFDQHNIQYNLLENYYLNVNSFQKIIDQLLDKAIIDSQSESIQGNRLLKKALTFYSSECLLKILNQFSLLQQKSYAETMYNFFCQQQEKNQFQFTDNTIIKHLNSLQIQSGNKFYLMFVKNLTNLDASDINNLDNIFNPPIYNEVLSQKLLAEMKPFLITQQPIIHLKSNYTTVNNIIHYNSVPLDIIFVRQLTSTKIQYHRYTLKNENNQFYLGTQFDNLICNQSISSERFKAHGRKHFRNQIYSDVMQAVDEFLQLIQDKFQANIVNRKLICRAQNITFFINFDNQNYPLIGKLNTLLQLCRQKVQEQKLSQNMKDFVLQMILENFSSKNFNSVIAEFPQELLNVEIQQYMVSNYKLFYTVKYIENNLKEIQNQIQYIRNQTLLTLNFIEYFVYGCQNLLQSLQISLSEPVKLQNNKYYLKFLTLPKLKEDNISYPCEIISYQRNQYREFQAFNGKFIGLRNYLKEIKNEQVFDLKYVLSDKGIVTVEKVQKSWQESKDGQCYLLMIQQ